MERPLRDEPNLNAVWARLLVETAAAHGIRQWFVAPGSRSSPLVRAVVECPSCEAVLWLDERGAAYAAVGHARATGVAAAVLTTSGTAVANLLPAAVEAASDGVPLLLVTADRPPELVDSSANQAIRQTALLAPATRWSVDVQPSDDRLAARYLVDAIAQATLRTVGFPPGPVHVNVRMREPLAPSNEPWSIDALEGLERWDDTPEGRRRREAPEAPGLHKGLPVLGARLLREPHGLVVAAGPCASDVAGLARALGWPLWADLRSGHRLGLDDEVHLPHVDRLLGRGFSPRTVLQVGTRPTSKRYLAWLERVPEVELHVLNGSHEGGDPTHRAGREWSVDPARAVDELRSWVELEAGVPRPIDPLLVRADRAVEATLTRHFNRGEADPIEEPALAHWLSTTIPHGHALAIGNSLAVRFMQSFSRRDGAAAPVALNRGASGIDGLVSTALGYAIGADRPTTLLLGDQSFLHDLNALASLAAAEGPPLVTIVVNNGGGGIFHLLPIGEHPLLVTPWMDAAHDFDFEGVVQGFGIAYRRVTTFGELAAAYGEAVDAGADAVIEAATTIESTLSALTAIDESLRDAIDEALRA